MKITWNIFSGCCRKNRSVNCKRDNPYVDDAPLKNSTTEEMEGDNCDGTQGVLNPNGDDVNFRINVTNGDEQDMLEVKLGSCFDNSHEVKTDAGSLDGKMEKDGSTISPRNAMLNDIKKTNSSLPNDSDSHINFSSEDEELGGEEIHKKRKITKTDCEGKEEDEITQSWNSDMKQIKKNLARINHLFEVYDGYKRKRNPLQISSEITIQESLKGSKSQQKDKKQELISQDVLQSLTKNTNANSTTIKSQSASLKKDSVQPLIIQEVSLSKSAPSSDFIDLTKATK